MPAIYSGQVNVGTTAVQIGHMHNQESRIIIHEDSGSDKIYIGGANVGTATGMHLEQDTYTTIDLPPGAAVYAIATSSAQHLCWLQVGV